MTDSHDPETKLRSVLVASKEAIKHRRHTNADDLQYAQCKIRAAISRYF